jgi:hypothetical protein
MSAGRGYYKSALRAASFLQQCQNHLREQVDQPLNSQDERWAHLLTQMVLTLWVRSVGPTLMGPKDP